MRIKLYNRRHFKKYRILNFFLLGIAVIGIGITIGGRVGSGHPLLERINAPLWLYILTWIFIFIALLGWVINTYNFFNYGVLEISKSKIELIIKNQVSNVDIDKIIKVNIQSNFDEREFEKGKINREIKISASDENFLIDCSLTNNEEKQLISELRKLEVNVE